MGYNASDEELRKAYRKLAIKYASSLEFSSPPHPSWLASRCLRHRVHLLSTQLHLLPRSQPPPRPSLLYIALAARYHPDKQKDEESAKVAAEKFRIVGHAHKVQ